MNAECATQATTKTIRIIVLFIILYNILKDFSTQIYNFILKFKDFIDFFAKILSGLPK